MKRIAKLCAVIVLGGAAALATAAELIDINRADAPALAQLHGVGPARAEAIVAERETNGPFRSIEDLSRVKGLGPSVIERNRDRVTIGDGHRTGAAN